MRLLVLGVFCPGSVRTFSLIKRMYRKYLFYILIFVGVLTASACARDIVEEVSYPEETAIELAKMCIVVDGESSGLKMSAQEAILTWEDRKSVV